MKKKKSLAKLKQELQKIFNKFIRLRDSENGYFTCISCGQHKRYEDMDAGHYYAVKGYDSLRFNEDNVHGECSGCNRFDESHLIGYGKRLSSKIGSRRLKELEVKAADYKMNGHKWYRYELEEMIVFYKKKLELFL